MSRHWGCNVATLGLQCRDSGCNVTTLNFDVVTLKIMSLLESRHLDAMSRLCKECRDIENVMSRH